MPKHLSIRVLILTVGLFLAFPLWIAGAAPSDPQPPPDLPMQLVPGGEITLLDGTTVSVEPFLIGEYEVTNADYALCVAAGGCTPPQVETTLDGTPYYSAAGYEDHPVFGVDQAQAEAFCAWAGMRLPTAVEWQKAAGWDPVAGQMRLYPWGDTFTGSEANVARVGAEGGLQPVGSYPAGASYYHVLDMSGNVDEWVAESLKMGGNWSSPPENATTGSWEAAEGEGVSATTGFRCVYSCPVCGGAGPGEAGQPGAGGTPVAAAMTPGAEGTQAATEAPTEPSAVETPPAEPTEAPTEVVTGEPTEEPTEEPTIEPTEEPTEVPTAEPTEVPTAEPTEVPTEEPEHPKVVSPPTEKLYPPEETGDTRTPCLGSEVTSAGAEQSDMRSVQVTWGGQPLSPVVGALFTSSLPGTVYGDSVQFNGNPVISGSLYDWGVNFTGTGEALFPLYGGGALAYVNSSGPWSVGFNAEGGVDVVGSPDYDSTLVVMAGGGNDLPTSYDVDHKPGLIFLGGSNAVFTYSAQAKVIKIYLIEGTLTVGDPGTGETFTGPDDGQNALAVTVNPDGSLDSQLVALAEAQALIPQKLKLLQVQIEMVEAIADSNAKADMMWTAAINLDGDITNGLNEQNWGPMYQGLGADMQIDARLGADGQITGAATFFKTENGEPTAVGEPIPITAQISDDRHTIQLQVSLDQLQQRMQELAITPERGGMVWRVATTNNSQPEFATDIYPEVDLTNLAAGAPAGGGTFASFNISYSTSSSSSTVSFEDNSVSGNPDNPITGRVWDFGDGTTSPEQSPQHPYAGGGEYTVTLTVTFADGTTDSMSIPVTVPGPPPPATPPSDVTTCQTTASSNANLRSGPGTNFDVAGNVTAGASLYVSGQNAAGDWYQLWQDGSQPWIAVFLVGPLACPEGFTPPVIP